MLTSRSHAYCPVLGWLLALFVGGFLIQLAFPDRMLLGAAVTGAFALVVSEWSFRIQGECSLLPSSLGVRSLVYLLALPISLLVILPGVSLSSAVPAIFRVPAALLAISASALLAGHLRSSSSDASVTNARVLTIVARIPLYVLFLIALVLCLGGFLEIIHNW